MRRRAQKVFKLFRKRGERIGKTQKKGVRVMPKYTCLKCSKEFWGWGVPYQYRKGDMLVCPECDGSLVETKDKPDLAIALKALFDDTAA